VVLPSANSVAACAGVAVWLGVVAVAVIARFGRDMAVGYLRQAETVAEAYLPGIKPDSYSCSGTAGMIVIMRNASLPRRVKTTERLVDSSC
jgi:hypothetical protein